MIPIKIQKEDKAFLVREIQDYVERELGDEIGNLAAEGLMDFILSKTAPYVYNQALEEARAAAMQQWERLDEELNLLQRPIQRRR